MSQMEKAAPPNPCSAPTGSRFGPPLSDGGELPFDLMLDVLLRVPGKDLCRLRAVCRRWRAATTDSVFVREHAARHGVQIFLANLRNDDAHVHVVDISGAVVKRINVSAAHRLLSARASTWPASPTGRTAVACSTRRLVRSCPGLRCRGREE
ncbi:hypothetical protein PR202_ga30460 [Eleusine coracana subsp. coracana]|uniref:F-box domain-containing protein n=1 Tax=Eleusine coracana subsp. coracana TaxID=191504 RepID=A0AAV5DPH4_ELECO|nr:hypothetical protein PR202_ga30460 [Eleusine coracana subsp. coracana]